VSNLSLNREIKRLCCEKHRIRTVATVLHVHGEGRIFCTRMPAAPGEKPPLVVDTNGRVMQVGDRPRSLGELLGVIVKRTDEPERRRNAERAGKAYLSGLAPLAQARDRWEEVMPVPTLPYGGGLPEAARTYLSGLPEVQALGLNGPEIDAYGIHLLEASAYITGSLMGGDIAADAPSSASQHVRLPELMAPVFLKIDRLLEPPEGFERWCESCKGNYELEKLLPIWCRTCREARRVHVELLRPSRPHAIFV
jgi:hypothetical protein